MEDRLVIGDGGKCCRCGAGGNDDRRLGLADMPKSGFAPYEFH